MEIQHGTEVCSGVKVRCGAMAVARPVSAQERPWEARLGFNFQVGGICLVLPLRPYAAVTESDAADPASDAVSPRAAHLVKRACMGAAPL
jgi:hypothetical protein